MPHFPARKDRFLSSYSTYLFLLSKSLNRVLPCFASVSKGPDGKLQVARGELNICQSRWGEDTCHQWSSAKPSPVTVLSHQETALVAPSRSWIHLADQSKSKHRQTSIPFDCFSMFPWHRYKLRHPKHDCTSQGSPSGAPRQRSQWALCTYPVFLQTEEDFLQKAKQTSYSVRVESLGRAPLKEFRNFVIRSKTNHLA